MDFFNELLHNINNASDTSAKDFFTLLAFAALAIGFIGSHHINEGRKRATDWAKDVGSGIWNEMGNAFDIFWNSGTETGGAGEAGFEAVKDGVKDLSGAPFQHNNNSNPDSEQ